MPILEVGNVCEEPKLKPASYQQQPMSNPYQYPQPQIVELVVQTPNGRRTFPSVPADKNVYDGTTNGLPIFVTEDKSLMLNELNVLKTQSENIVKGYERNKELIGIYDGMIGTLNPEEAEKKRNEAKIASLEKGFAQQQELNNRLMERIEALMSKLDGANKTSKNKEQ